MPRQMYPNNANQQGGQYPNAQNAKRAQGGQEFAAPPAGASSPAFIMASRIKNEQGVSRAAEYLAAMSPYLAPGERQHIASLLSLPQVQPSPPPQYQPQYAPPQYQPPLGAGMGAGMGAGTGDAMQMMNMLSMLNGGGLGNLLGGANAANAGGANNPMGNPMLLAQLLGGMMGKK